MLSSISTLLTKAQKQNHTQYCAHFSILVSFRSPGLQAHLDTISELLLGHDPGGLQFSFVLDHLQPFHAKQLRTCELIIYWRLTGALYDPNKLTPLAFFMPLLLLPLPVPFLPLPLLAG